MADLIETLTAKLADAKAKHTDDETCSEEYMGHTVTTDLEKHLGGWTCWVGSLLLLRELGGPRVFGSAKAALAAGRKWIREDSDASQ